MAKEEVFGSGRSEQVTRAEENGEDQMDLTTQLLQQTQQELVETKDRYLRALADLQNLKKKMAQERHEARDRGALSIIEELLPVVDNLERAEEALQRNNGVQSLKEGLALIFNQLRESLKKKGIEPIKALGEAFDPHYHEAAGRVPTNDVAEGRVVAELQRGYRMGGRIIRPSKVMVATKPED